VKFSLLVFSSSLVSAAAVYAAPVKYLVHRVGVDTPQVKKPRGTAKTWIIGLFSVAYQNLTGRVW